MHDFNNLSDLMTKISANLIRTYVAKPNPSSKKLSSQTYSLKSNGVNYPNPL